MAYFNNDFDDLFKELNNSFFNDDLGGNAIPVHFSGNAAGPQTVQRAPAKMKKKPIGVDLVAQAKNNKFDPVIGRDNEIDNVIEILNCF